MGWPAPLPACRPPARRCCCVTACPNTLVPRLVSVLLTLQGRLDGDAAAGCDGRAGADRPADGRRAVGDRAVRPGGAVRARQRVVLAVLAADHAGAAGGVPAAG